MNQETWTAVDHYITDVLGLSDDVLEATLTACDAAGLPPIAVSVPQGKLLNLVARIRGTQRILEIGTLGGYSTIWLARALPPGGRLITLEIDPKRAEVARSNVANAGLAERVDIRVGPAIETLPKIAAEKSGPFDLVFIDADKPSIPDYFTWSMKMSRPGTVIIVDNVVREGAVIYEASEDASVIGVRRLNDMVADDPRVSVTVVQTVGTKGYDGFLIAVVL